MMSSQELAEQLSGQAPRSLASEAARGVVWTTIQSLVVRLSGFLVFLVLARLLAPTEFGLLAAAMVFVALSRTLAEAGLTRTLVQRPRLRAAHLDSALLVSGGLGLVLSLSLVAVAPVISNLYHLPELRLVLMVLAVVPVVTAVSSVPESILRRQLRFRSVAMRSMSSVMVSGVLGVGLAIVGAGVWALVAQMVSQVVIALVVLWAYVGWMPSRHWERDAVKELMSFGSHVLGISVISFVNRRTGELIIGVVLGPVALGLFSVAMKILTVMLDLLVSNVSKVALPVFSRLADQPARLAEAYLRATRVTTFVAFPGFTLLALFGNQLSVVVFGPQWAAAGPLMSVLALVGPAQSIALFNNSVMLATGHSRLALRWTTTTAALNVAGFILSARFGILVMVIVYAATVCLRLPVGLYLTRRVSAVRLSDQVRTLAVPFAGCISMLVVVTGLRLAKSLSPTAILVVGVPLAAVAYLAVTLPFRRDVVTTATALMRSRRTPATATPTDSSTP